MMSILYFREEERSGTDEEWKVAWCNWAYSRKRGKLAQFIIRNLQMGDYSRYFYMYIS